MRKVKPVTANHPEQLAQILGLPAATAREWQVQYDLLKRLKEIVQRKKLTHTQVANVAGTSRTRITAILNDDLNHVSTDLLIRILGCLGYRVHVSVTKAVKAA
jgi:predicted XRE-type DNA-binding protein